MWTSMGIRNSYTMEVNNADMLYVLNICKMNTYTNVLRVQATFCGSSLGRQSGIHFTTADLEEMGYHFCDTLLDYCDPDQTKVFFIQK